MKTLSITEIHGMHGPTDSSKIVTFSDGKKYESGIMPHSQRMGWDCSLRLLSSQRTVTSPLRRRMVLEHLGLESAVTRKERTHVDNLRRALRKYGYRLQKSYVSKLPHEANHGGYQVQNGDGEIAIGHWYSATLEQVEAFLAAKAAEFRVGG